MTKSNLNIYSDKRNGHVMLAILSSFGFLAGYQQLGIPGALRRLAVYGTIYYLPFYFVSIKKRLNFNLILWLLFVSLFFDFLWRLVSISIMYNFNFANVIKNNLNEFIGPYFLIISILPIFLSLMLTPLITRLLMYFEFDFFLKIKSIEKKYSIKLVNWLGFGYHLIILLLLFIAWMFLFELFYFSGNGPGWEVPGVVTDKINFGIPFVLVLSLLSFWMFVWGRGIFWVPKGMLIYMVIIIFPILKLSIILKYFFPSQWFYDYVYSRGSFLEFKCYSVLAFASFIAYLYESLYCRWGDLAKCQATPNVTP